MTEHLDLPRRYRDKIETLLREHVPGVEVWAYGSRVNGRSHESSDLDLVLRGPDLKRIPSGQLADLIKVLEESNVPILVQTQDWARLPESFHREIEREYVVLVEREEWGSGNETLADFVNITMGQSPPGNTVFSMGDIPLLNGPTEFGPHHPTPAQFTTSPRKYAQVGDILFCVRGSTTGRMNWADQKYAIGRGIAAIRHRWTAKLQPFVRAVIEFELPELLAQATGSTFPNVSATQLATIPYPNLSGTEQRAIAHILGTLDDKIELNRRMNETLEEMARALFKSWFVDFDPVRAKMEGLDTGLPPDIADLFPDRLVDSELGEIPERWEVKALGELIELAYGKALKADDRKSGSIPVYGSNGQVGWHDKKLAAGPGIVVGRKGNPGIVTWAHSDFFPIDTTFYVVPRNTEGDLPFLFFALTTQDLPSIAADSAVPGLNRNLAYMNRQLVPDKQVIDEFNHYAIEIFTRRHRLEEESRTLAALRDALLPKLMSGELWVRDTKQFTRRTI